MNPYTPSINTQPYASGNKLHLAWNTCVAGGLFTLVVYSLTCISADYERWMTGANVRAGSAGQFAVFTAQNFQMLIGIAFVLLGLSTAPLNRHRSATRILAVAVLLLTCFDIPSAAFTPRESAIRAFMFSFLMLPMLIFGCGFPRTVAQINAWIRDQLRETASG